MPLAPPRRPRVDPALPIRERNNALLALHRSAPPDTAAAILEELLRLNDPLARLAASRFNAGLPHDDALAAARTGLLTAISRFDPSRGTSLSAYAMWWMRKRIQVDLAAHRKHADRCVPLETGHDAPLADDPLVAAEIRVVLASLPPAPRATLASRNLPTRIRLRARTHLLHPALSSLAGEWTLRGACRGTGIDPISRDGARSLRALCPACPARAECAAFAAHHALLGCWG